MLQRTHYVAQIGGRCDCGFHSRARKMYCPCDKPTHTHTPFTSECDELLEKYAAV